MPTEVVAAAFVAIDIAVVTTLLPAISKAIAAFRALRGAMLSTPIGIAATGVAALATAAYDKAQQYERGGQERQDLLQGVFDAEGVSGYEDYIKAATGAPETVADWRKIEESAAARPKVLSLQLKRNQILAILATTAPIQHPAAAAEENRLATPLPRKPKHTLICLIKPCKKRNLSDLPGTVSPENYDHV